MKFGIFILSLFVSTQLVSQEIQYYENNSEQRHICGPFDLDDLIKDSIYGEWYMENYQDEDGLMSSPSWAGQLRDVQVDIYIGTWCGDSKYYLPRFIKVWESLGLSEDQLKFTALYDGIAKYKQGPNGEEKGKNIHRVPTFIFSRGGGEIARIVERPTNDLFIDIAQIAHGFPSIPYYKGVEYIYDLFEMTDVTALDSIFENTIDALDHQLRSSYELNTAGYVFMTAGEIEKANFLFKLNTELYPSDSHVYYSYGRSLYKLGRIDEAATQYEKVLLLDPSHSRARTMLREIRELQ